MFNKSYFLLLSLLMSLSVAGCQTFDQAKEMPIPKTLEQADVQIRSVIAGLRKVNANMMNMGRYGSAKGLAVKRFLDCVKGHADTLKTFMGHIDEPEKLLESRNLLNILLLIETRKFGGTHEVADGCRLTG